MANAEDSRSEDQYELYKWKRIAVDILKYGAEESLGTPSRNNLNGDRCHTLNRIVVTDSKLTRNDDAHVYTL